MKPGDIVVIKFDSKHSTDLGIVVGFAGFEQIIVSRSSSRYVDDFYPCCYVIWSTGALRTHKSKDLTVV